MNAPLTPRPTVRGALPSQLLVDELRVSGPLADAAVAAPGARLSLRFAPGAPRPATHLAGALCRSAEAPSCTWSIDGASGVLTPMGFVAAWNEGVLNVDGHPVDLEIDEGPGLELPFAAWHPSGLLQAVRFDREAGVFVRRILYPIATAEARHAMAANLDGTDAR